MLQGPPYEKYYDSRGYFDRYFRTHARQMRMRASSPAAQRAWAAAAGRKLIELLGLKRLVGTAPRPRMTESVDCGDHFREHWLIQTQRGVTLPFYLLRPKDAAGPLPAVICPHGHGGGGKVAVAGVGDNPLVAKAIEDYNYAYGVQFARAGLLAFCPDARGFGQRQEREVRSAVTASSCHVLQMMGCPLGVPVAGMWTFDLMRLMDHIQQRRDVRRDRVGCAGLSGGGLQTLCFAAVDTRVACAVISGYFYGARESLLQMPGNCSCNMIPHMWENFDQGDVGAIIAPRPLLIETGDADNLNGAPGLANVIPQVKITRRAYRLLGAADRLRHDIFAGPHRWHGTQAVAWMIKWLTAQQPRRSTASPARGKPGRSRAGGKK
jgi:dienelactone hydrolase